MRLRQQRWPRVAIVCAILAVAAGLTTGLHFGGARWTGGTPMNTNSRPRPVQVQPSGLPQAPGHESASNLTPLWIALGALVAIFLVAIVVRFLRHRTVPIVSTHAAPAQFPRGAIQPNLVRVQSGVEQALAYLNAEYEPADAILRAWLGVQDSAEQSGMTRGPSETPTEFTTRITKRAFIDNQAIHVLLQLYLQVRFGQHEVTTNDVDEARTALEQLAATWGAINARVR